MALSVLLNCAKMSVSGTPGVGPITLGVALPGCQTFASAGVANSDTISYRAEDGASWEIGQGVYATSGPTLTRTSIVQSTSGGFPISLTSVAIVIATALASDFKVVYPNSFTVAQLASIVGAPFQILAASNGRAVGEGPGAGTGCLVYYRGGAWRVVGLDYPVEA